MPILRLACCLLLTGLLVLAALAPARAAKARETAEIAELCLSAARRAERTAGLPQGIVTGIMLAETGRWSQARGRSYPWPWTITSGTDAWYAASRAEAIATVRRLQAEGRRNIDVGCMQINLHWHPDAFRTIEEALDPVRNVAYGTAFLGELHAEHGDWRRAVAAYHSRDPARGQAYLARVEKLQAQQRFWSKGELRTAFAEVSAGQPVPLPPEARRAASRRLLVRGNVLLAAMEAPVGVTVTAAPGSLIRLRRDFPGGQITLNGSFLFSGTPSPQMETLER